MAFSYTKASGESGYMDGGIQIEWTNRWSVTEVTPETAGMVRLKVDVVTEYYRGYPLDYVFYATDTISYNGTSYTIHAQTAVNANYNYTAYVEVPRSWIGKTVRLYICYKTVDVTFNAVGATASTITASNGTFGTAMSITLTQAVSGVRHTLTYEFPAGASSAATGAIATSSTSKSFTWTPSLETFAPKISSANSGTMRFRCTSVLDGVTIGTTTKDVTVSIASSAAVPVKKAGAGDWVTFTPSNTISGFDGVWIQGYSKAVATFNDNNITTYYGATIKSHSITYGGVTDSESQYETAVLNTTSASIICKATDTRNKVLSETKTITLNAYSKPTITNVSVYRSGDSAGTASESGSRISLRATANVSSVNSRNTGVLQYRIRQSGGAWSSWATLTSGALTTTPTESYSANYTFEVQIRLYDTIQGSGNATTVTRSVPSQRWAMKFREDGNGVAFGKSAEIANALELPTGWSVVIRGPSGESTPVLDYDRLNTLPHNTNLLLNWDWRHAVNQSGSSSYTAGNSMTAAFDACRHSNGTLSVSNGVWTWTSTQGAVYKRIQLKVGGWLYSNIPYTLTIFARATAKGGGVILRPCDTLSAISGASGGTALTVTSGFVPVSFSFTPTATAQDAYAEILCGNTASDYATVSIAAWKLEVGSAQTLVRTSGTGYYLYDQAVYQEELAKCNLL